MDYIYISQNGDRESILERRNQLMVLSDKEIVSQYNREAKMGIVGVRAQILHIIALHQVFLKRFKKSPIKIVKTKHKHIFYFFNSRKVKVMIFKFGKLFRTQKYYFLFHSFI